MFSYGRYVSTDLSENNLSTWLRIDNLIILNFQFSQIVICWNYNSRIFCNGLYANYVLTWWIIIRITHFYRENSFIILKKIFPFHHILFR